MPTIYGHQIAHKSIDISSASDTTIVSSVTGKQIVVVSLFLVSGGSLSIKFQSTTATDLHGSVAFTAQSVLSLGINEYGWFKTNSGELLNLELVDGSAGTLQLSGSLGYFLE